LPKSDKEITLKIAYSQSEIVFKQNKLQPGIYLVFVTLVESGTSSSAAVTETEDFAIFKFVQRRLETFIRGGKRREIGNIRLECVIMSVLLAGYVLQKTVVNSA